MTEPINQHEFNVLYQNQLDTISEFKDKAWKTTHYSVLGQAAVFALSRTSDCPILAQQWWLTALSVAVFFWAAALVNHLQGRLVGRRQALRYLRGLRSDGDFKESFDDVWEKIKEKKDPELRWWDLRKRWNDDPWIFFAYATAISVPFGVVLLFIWW